jgi:uncharacterized protein Veg
MRQQNAESGMTSEQRLAKEQAALASLDAEAQKSGRFTNEAALEREKTLGRIAGIEQSIAQQAAKDISVAVQTTELDSAEEAIAALQTQKSINVALKTLGVESINDAKAKLDSVDGTDIALTLQALGVDSIEEAKAKLDAASGKDVALTLQALGVSSIDEAKAALDSAQGKDVALAFEALGVQSIEEAKAKLDSADGKDVALTLQTLGVATIEEAKAKLDSADGKDVALTLQALGVDSIEEAKAKLDSADGKTVQIVLDALGTNSLDEAIAKLNLLDEDAKKAIANLQKAQNAALSARASDMRAANAETAATQGMSDSDLLFREQGKLAKLDEEAMGAGRYTNEAMIEREAITQRILALEGRIAATREGVIKGIEQQIADREFAGMSPGEQQAQLDAQLAAFDAQVASGALSPEQAAQQAARLIQMSDSINGQQGFQGSQGASAFQRVGFASNEFFDTRKGKDPAAETARAVGVLQEIKRILDSGQPLVLASTNS